MALASTSASVQLVPATMGSLLRVALAPQSRVWVRPRAVIGMSGSTSTRIAIDQSSASVWRRLAGGPLMLEKVTASADGNAELLVAPSTAGDVVIIELSAGGLPYTIARPSAFLLATDGATVTTRYRPLHKVRPELRVLALPVSATSAGNQKQQSSATLALHASLASVHRLKLVAGEEYLVRANNLLAWSAAAEPLHLAEAQLESTLATTSIAAFVQHWVVVNARRAVARVTGGVRAYFTGSAPGMLRLQGPGDFYITSRPPPSCSWSGPAGAYAALKHEGEVLRASVRQAARARDDRGYAVEALPKDDQPVATSSVVVDRNTGTVRFLASSAPSIVVATTSRVAGAQAVVTEAPPSTLPKGDVLSAKKLETFTSEEREPLAAAVARSEIPTSERRGIMRLFFGSGRTADQSK